MATAGKINMNYQMMPFGAYVSGTNPYIKRATGLYAVMKSTRFMALAANDSATYKPYTWLGNYAALMSGTRRHDINVSNTLAKGFEARFQNNDIFRSATEICDIDLYPPNTLNMTTFWDSRTLTGDNLREKPYADIYPRLTTKSNVFTVHVKAQSLKKALPKSTQDPATSSPWAEWDETKDQVLGEYRGSSIIERYIDPNAGIPDFATLSDPTSQNINEFYKFRTVSTKQFGQ
jgi:hypothetical protein